MHRVRARRDVAPSGEERPHRHRSAPPFLDRGAGDGPGAGRARERDAALPDERGPALGEILPPCSLNGPPTLPGRCRSQRETVHVSARTGSGQRATPKARPTCNQARVWSGPVLLPVDSQVFSNKAESSLSGSCGVGAIRCSPTSGDGWAEGEPACRSGRVDLRGWLTGLSGVRQEANADGGSRCYQVSVESFVTG